MYTSAFNNLPTLETPRLLLRALTLRDVADIFSYGRNPEVARYTLWDPHRTLEEARMFVADVIAARERGEANPWGVVLKETGRLVGTVGFGEYLPQHSRAEVGYALAQPVWGKGLATEALQETLRAGFEKFQLNRIEARCLVENLASARVLEKAGLTYEGTFKDYLAVKGRYADVRQYALLAGDWYSNSVR